MSRVIEPVERIEGAISISGAKNSSLLLLAAVVLATEKVVIDNIPPLADVKKMCRILQALNVRVKWLECNKLEIDPSAIEYKDLDFDICGEIRTSILFVGVMLGRFGRVKVQSPGGCKLGQRPVNFHIDAMREMGADISDNGKIISGSLSGSKDAEIRFGKISVTGVVNALFCAVTRDAKTVIRNCALEPEVDDCILLLRGLGSDIKRMGSTIIIQGGKIGGGLHHTVIPDRIEAGTFLILTAMVGGRVELKGVKPQYMQSLIEKLRGVGAKIEVGSSSILLEMNSRPIGVDIVASPYPGFPTDLQPQWSALATISQGSAKIVDTVYSSRFDHLYELEKMGARFEKFENGVIISGVDKLFGAQTCARNLRSAAALIIAAKVALGSSKIESVSHLDRGYYDFFGKLSQVEKHKVNPE